MEARGRHAVTAAFAQCDYVTAREPAVCHQLHVDDIPGRRARHEDGETIAMRDSVAAGGNGFDANLREHIPA
jgi:hypothetical protein